MATPDEQPTLELISPAASRPDAPRQLWYLVTNQLNLMFMLSAGLVTGPRGFGGKHYADPLSLAPGWIPLFGGGIPPAALAQATSEARHLEPVIAGMDLRALRGSIQALDRQGRQRTLRWPEEARGDEAVLWIPAPLPIAWLQVILFPSQEARALVREQAADYANVPLAAYKQQIKTRLFSAKSILAWPGDGLSLPDRDRSVHHVSAVGAVQALLFGLGNRGDTLVRTARLLADLSETAAERLENPLLRGVVDWAFGTRQREDADRQARMLAGLLGAIVAAKDAADGATDRESCPPDGLQVVLDLLEAECQALAEPKWQEALTRLIADLQGLIGLGDATVSELLHGHPRPFSRGLILFFLHHRCDELLAIEQPMLTDQDLVVAAALFGGRGGWMGLPQALKDAPGLTAAITHRMAALAHRLHSTGVDPGPAPPRVQPLRELMTAGDAGWSRRQREAALQLARNMGWQQVLKTRISLGKGDYRLQVDGRGAHLLLDGDVKAVSTDVDPNRVLELLPKTTIPSKVDRAVRAALKV